MNRLDLIIVGAGFAGMYTAIQAKQEGLNYIGIDAASDFGGTWYWNRYPGARCDVESVDYAFSFDPKLEQEWRWSERYATQPEILRYFKFVADRYDLARGFEFNTRVSGAQWDEDTHMWTVQTDDGRTYEARWLVMATGPLSVPVEPNIPGKESFAGETYLTSQWPHEPVDFTGKRVAVIGTGSSGIQAVPEIAKQSKQLYVLQRTPNYSVPAFNRLLDDEEWAYEQENLHKRRKASWNSPAGSPWDSYSQDYDSLTEEERTRALEESWERGGVLFSKTFDGQMVHPRINDVAKNFFEQKLSEVVKDPEVRDRLTPKGYPIGTKRICTDSGFYDVFNRDDVTLVSLKEDPIEEVVPEGIKTASGLLEVDVIVYATGFDAMTGALTSIDIRGRDGRSIAEAWADGYQTYFGLGVPGYPNLINLNGPGSPSVFANMALTSEQQGNFALGLIAHCQENGFTSAEPRADAAADWVEHVNETAAGTLFLSTASWYTGENLEGKPRTFLPYPGGFGRYNDAVSTAVDGGYEGYVLSVK